MAKFYGVIGYAEPTETRAGVWEDVMKEYPAKGDVLRNQRRMEDGDKVNDDLSLNNQISIIADPYAQAHYFAIRYVKWMGGYWKVTNVEVQYPRLLLTIGGLYRGQKA